MHRADHTDTGMMMTMMIVDLLDSSEQLSVCSETGRHLFVATSRVDGTIWVHG